MGPRTGCKPAYDWLHKIPGYIQFFKGLKKHGQVVMAALDQVDPYCPQEAREADDLEKTGVESLLPHAPLVRGGPRIGSPRRGEACETDRSGGRHAAEPH